MLNQASNISPDEVNGSGCVDLLNDLVISWQVNGDTALTGYEIIFYANDATSTQLYTTGQVTLTTPFWGINYKGESQRFSVTISAATIASAGLSNGNEYKFVVSQYTTGTSDPITQTTPSFFYARTTPTLAVNAIASPVTSRSLSITGTYTQAENVPLAWVRWQIAEASSQDEPFVDTGKIYGTGELQVDYEGFFTNTEYSVRLTGETTLGISADTGWVDFTVQYSVGETPGTATACQLANDTAVFLQWDRIDLAQGYSVYRQEVGKSVLQKIAELDGTTGQLRDYSAKSGKSYIYYIFPVGALAYLTEPLVTDPTPIQFGLWSIIEAQENDDGTYGVIATHVFRMGEGGVSEGSFSNNNAPQLLKNFTPYPTWQPETSNYLSGSVSGYIGTINDSSRTYSDTITQSDAIFQLSNSTNTLFYNDPKGHFLKIRFSGEVSMTVDHKKLPQPQTVSVMWAEVGSTDGVSLIAAPGGDFYPKDAIITSTIRIDLDTGALIWTTPEDYPYGSTLAINSTGALIQTADGSFIPASMAIDYDTGALTATI